MTIHFISVIVSHNPFRSSFHPVVEHGCVCAVFILLCLSPPLLFYYPFRCRHVGCHCEIINSELSPVGINVDRP